MEGAEMKAKWIFPIILATLAFSGCGKKEAGGVVLDSNEKKISYVLGMNIAQEVKNTGVTIDADTLAQGFRDNFSGGKLLLDEKQVNEALKLFQQEVFSQKSQKSLREEEAFMMDNGKKPDVKTTESGLQYKVLAEGQGPKPKAEDTVRVHYRGYLPNNQEFDSSYKRGQPVEFPLQGVIKGWTEALQLMPVGSKYQLFIPAKLGYGERGMPPVIGPNQMLIFDVELLDIVKPGAKK
jgi:FKBP-type peptidyl-prolyl cis-trans isomerase